MALLTAERHDEDIFEDAVDQPQAQFQLDQNGLTTYVYELLMRMEKCETSLSKKEVEITNLKRTVSELRTEVKKTQSVNEELQNFNKELEFKVNILQTKQEFVKKNSEGNDDGGGNNVGGGIPLSLLAMISSHHEEMKKLDQLIKEQSGFSHTEMKRLESLIEEKGDILQNDLSNLERKFDLNGTGGKNFNKKELISHVENIENVLFCHNPNANRELQYKWVLTNYKYNRDHHGVVESPVFYPEINGYAFKLIVDWCGEAKKRLGLYLKLCRGRGGGTHVKLEPFRVQFRLDILHKYNGCKGNRISFAHLDAEKEDCFTILPGESEAKHSYGNYKMLTMPELDEYVINDSMFITCSFLFSAVAASKKTSSSLLPFLNW